MLNLRGRNLRETSSEEKVICSTMNTRKRHKHKETISSQECTAKHFYILEQTAADYSVIILTILIMWLYCYDVTSHGNLNQISSYVITSALCRPYGYIALVVGSTNILFFLSLSVSGFFCSKILSVPLLMVELFDA